MDKVTRIIYKGQAGFVQKCPSLFATKPFRFYPNQVAGMSNRGSFIPLSQAELDAARGRVRS